MGWLLLGSREAGAADRLARFAGRRGGRVVRVVGISGRRLEERALLGGCTSFIRVELLPLFRIFDFGFQIGCGATVGADKDGVGSGGEEGANAFVVPCVRARGDEETLTRLGIVSGLVCGGQR